jgi:hypothetical protein
MQNFCIRPSNSFLFLFFFFFQIKFRPLRHLLILPPSPKFRLQVGLQNGASSGNPYGDTIHVASMYFDKHYCHQLCLLLLQTTCKYLQSSLYLLIWYQLFLSGTTTIQSLKFYFLDISISLHHFHIQQLDYEVTTVWFLKIQGLWGMTPWHWESSSRRFEGSCFLLIQDRAEVDSAAIH